MADDTSLKLGQIFSSFEEVKAAISRYEKKNYVNLYVSDSRTISSTIKRTPSKVIKAELQYSHINYACVAGGRTFKSKSKGTRPNQSTFRKDCNMEVKLRATKDCNFLEVAVLNETHNHECDEQRRLGNETLSKTDKLLKMKCNKKVLQNHLQTISGKVVTCRDISNMKAKLSSSKSNRNDIEKLVKKLRENEGATAEVVVDEENNLLGIYYQDKPMKIAYDSFPEMLFIDATYKLNELKMPLYIMLGEDGNGESEIFCTFIVSNEEKPTIQKMVQIFKNHNPTWTETKTVMTDKDFVERQVFKEEFPNVHLSICLFHSQRSFRREVTTDKMGITPEERNLCLEIFQKMSYAKNEEEYQSLYADLEKASVPSVLEYFKSNWHENHREWVEGLKSANLTFLNRTNNRLESLNQKIKTVCTRNTGLDQFYEELLVVFQSIRTTRDHRAITFLQKRPVCLYAEGTAEARYMTLLHLDTPYAFGYVVQQLQLATKVKNVHRKELGITDDFEVDASSGKLTVSDCHCDCAFFTVMMLPCRHIFAVRSILKKDAFDLSICATRWTVAYYKSKHHVLKSRGHEFSSTPDEMSPICVQQPATKKIMSQHEKYRKTFATCQALATCASEFPMREFHQKNAILEMILAAWRNENVEIQPDKSVPLADVNTTQPQAVCSQIKIPPVMPKRGRPKGADLTVIGIPRKRKEKKSSGKDKPTPFMKKHATDKDKVMLSWLLSKDDVTSALSGGIIDETAVEVRPEKVHPGLIDENVNVSRLRPYFNKDAWLLVNQIIAQVRQDPTWLCNVCKCDVEEDCVSCDSCLNWFHFECVTLKNAPKAKYWFCRKCHSLCKNK
ncbi:zinc finger SWIM domain-containing 1-like [Paramuricea clavata]|uniref:Zinc finger SWIM domain-containing 1-like n=1 Tax=Paramuricea clavata TaxID=317549 RepID=A0A6S7HGJ9_PARCT|nr:zinc finger SWIM domain-containing 1-like [Paramuricea clavata]